METQSTLGFGIEDLFFDVNIETALFSMLPGSCDRSVGCRSKAFDLGRQIVDTSIQILVTIQVLRPAVEQTTKEYATSPIALKLSQWQTGNDIHCRFFLWPASAHFAVATGVTAWGRIEVGRADAAARVSVVDAEIIYHLIYQNMCLYNWHWLSHLNLNLCINKASKIFQGMSSAVWCLLSSMSSWPVWYFVVLAFYLQHITYHFWSRLEWQLVKPWFFFISKELWTESLPVGFTHKVYG